MPIKFRCPHCQQFLGISRAKAGTVSDCPTCGHTIRIPNLDGRVNPLPDPQLDLRDDQLMAALGALAELEPSSSVSSQRDQARIVSAAPAVHAERAEAEPREFEVIAEPVPNVEDASEFSVLDDQDVVAELQNLASTAAAVPKTSAPPRWRVGPFWLLLTGILCCGMGILIGWGLHRGQTVPATPDKAVVAPKKAAAPQLAQPEMKPVPGMSSLSGTVTYSTPTAPHRPDGGARVLLLPMDRQGTSMLPPQGLRVGAVAADRELLRAAAASLSGGFQIADKTGEFTVPVENAGEYGLLIVSRYQPRPESARLPDDCRAFLRRYFENPEQVPGNVQVSFRRVRIDADSPAKTVSVHFPAP